MDGACLINAFALEKRTGKQDPPIKNKTPQTKNKNNVNYTERDKRQN